MSSKVFDAMYTLAIALVFLGYVAVQYSVKLDVLSHWLLVFVAFFLAAGIFLLTTGGKSFKNQAREAREESYKVVWPSYDEVTKSTLMIGVAVTVVAIFLWILDSVLMKVYNLVL